MMLIDKYLSEYSFIEAHSRDVAAKPRTVIDAVANYRPEEDPFFRTMIGLRELPMRVGALLAGKKAEVPQPFGLQNFLLLERQDDRELAYGLIGRFWRPDFGLVTPPDAEAFLKFDAPGVAKLALGFSAAVQKNGATRLSTETRVFCPDLACRLKFAPYWYLIRPVSGLIRRRVLATIKRNSESVSWPTLLQDS